MQIFKITNNKKLFKNLFTHQFFNEFNLYNKKKQAKRNTRSKIPHVHFFSVKLKPLKFFAKSRDIVNSNVGSRIHNIGNNPVEHSWESEQTNTHTHVQTNIHTYININEWTLEFWISSKESLIIRTEFEIITYAERKFN